MSLPRTPLTEEENQSLSKHGYRTDLRIPNSFYEQIDGDRNFAYPAIYAFIYPLLKAEAREHGYSLALQGSLAKDLDVVAIPWTKEAVGAEALAERLIHACGGFLSQGSKDGPTIKEHGRMVWTILLHGGPYIDLSIMPRSDANGANANSNRATTA